MIKTYNNFLIENQFNQIISEIFLITESEGRWINDREYVWDIEQPNKSNIEKSLDKLRDLISKIDKDQIRHYYIRLVNKLKPLPDRMRRFLLTHYTSVFLAAVSFGYLLGGGTDDTQQTNQSPNKEQKVETIDPKIKKELIELNKKSSFEEAQSSVKEVEAGYSDDRGDTGNWVEVPGGKRFVGTNHGISAPILQKYLGRIPKREDMENLSYQTALEIYKKDYWDAQNLSDICDQSVANVIYDGCVNQGIDGMSEVIRNAAKEQGINLTGSVYSKNNLRRLNSLNQKELFNSIKKFRESRYKEAATWNRHGEGWLNRLASIEYQTVNQA
jgi:lysozyme family protein